MAKKAETRFSDRVRMDLHQMQKDGRCWFTKIQQVAIRGIPDYLVCVGGRFVAIELKREDGIEPDALQTYNLRKITQCHGVSYVATPENWDEILMLIEGIVKDSGLRYIRKSAAKS